MITQTELLSMKPREAYSRVLRHVFEKEQDAAEGVSLPHELKVFCLVADLHGDTINGGLAQYFTNSSSENYLKALEGLLEIGANKQEQIVKKWLRCLPPGVDPQDRADVGRHIFADPVLLKRLKGIDSEYFGAQDDFYRAAVAYVSRNPSSFDVEV